MSLPLILLPEAQSEFDDAVDWYDQQKAGLGQKFIDAVHVVLARIGDTPQLYGITYKDVRQALVRRFPYAILFRVEADQVVVVAIIHTSRDAKLWRARV